MYDLDQLLSMGLGQHATFFIPSHARPAEIFRVPGGWIFTQCFCFVVGDTTTEKVTSVFVPEPDHD